MSVVAFLASCSKDNGGDTPAPVEPQIVVPKKEVETYRQEIYKNGAFVEVDLRRETDYTVVDNRITKVVSASYEGAVKLEESESVITYDGGLITKGVDSFRQGNATPTVLTTDYTYSAGKLTKIINKSSNATTTSNYEYQGDRLVKTSRLQEMGYYTVSRTITYNYLSETQIKVVEISVSSGFGQVRTSTNEVEYTLDAQKRVIKQVKKDEGQTTTREYTYDDKNNFMSVDAFKVANPESFLSPELAKNNVVSKKEIQKGSFFNREETTTYTYTYNDKGYPTRVEEKTEREGEPAKTSVAEYTY